jgi:hypothetical protein
MQWALHDNLAMTESWQREVKHGAMAAKKMEHAPHRIQGGREAYEVALHWPPKRFIPALMAERPP